MTPLAYRITRDLCHEENAANRAKIRKFMEEIHCFECSEVFELANDLMGDIWAPATKLEPLDHLIFLPAPKTWLEFKTPPTPTWSKTAGHIFAFHLEELKDAGRELIRVFVCENSAGADTSKFVPCGYFQPKSLKVMVQRDEPSLFALAESVNENAQLQARTWSRLVVALLALINSPKIIGRKQHMPNRTLERKLTKNLAGGKFPLRAWTEIKLQVSKPPEIDDGEPHEAHLTGRRALHFCRAHLRIRLGQLEYVTSHWRGDPSIGIKQSRYLVTH